MGDEESETGAEGGAGEGTMKDERAMVTLDFGPNPQGVSPVRSLAKSELIRAVCVTVRDTGLSYMALRIDGDDLVQLLDECDKIEAEEKAKREVGNG